MEPSLGFELGYWGGGFEFANIGFPFGADLGVEFTRTRWRLYSEAQAGWIAGLSAGPYLELPYSQAPAAFGLQGSTLGSYFAGADLRGRIGTDGRTLSPGVFGKFIHCEGGPDYCWNGGPSTPLQRPVVEVAVMPSRSR